MKLKFLYVFFFFITFISITTRGVLHTGIKICNDSGVPVDIKTNINNMTLKGYDCKKYPWIYLAKDGCVPCSPKLNRMRLSSTKTDSNPFLKTTLCLNNIRHLETLFHIFFGRISRIDVCDSGIFMLPYAIHRSPAIFGNNHANVTMHIKGDQFNLAGSLQKTCTSIHPGKDNNSIIAKCHAPLKGAFQYYGVTIKRLDILKHLIIARLWSNHTGFVNACGKAYKNKHKTMIDCAAYPGGNRKFHPSGSYYNSCKMVLYDVEKKVLYAACPQGKSAITLYRHKHHWLIEKQINPQVFPTLVYSISKLTLGEKTCSDIVNQHGQLACNSKNGKSIHDMP